MMDHNIEIRKSLRAKRLRLQISSEGKVTVVVPRFTPAGFVERFVGKQHGWIQAHLQKITKKQALRPKIHYQTGDIFYWLGEPLTLLVQPSKSKRPTLKIAGSKLVATLHSAISRAEGVAAIKKLLENFYKKKAAEFIHDRLEHFNEHYRFRYHRVTFRNQKSRWGSCSAQGNLNFNWRLAMAPIEAIDYVVIHELCHLREMNHSKRFWALVAAQMPAHKKWRKWIRDNQYLLSV